MATNEVKGSSVVVSLLVQAYRKMSVDTVERDANRNDQVGEAARIVLKERAEQNGGS